MFFKYVKEPMLFQGRKKSKNYFEGWYFKQVSTDLKNTVSIIPGISKDIHDAHAFIQTIITEDNPLGARHETHYHRFPPEDFLYEDNPFCLRIGGNTFTYGGIELSLSDDGYSMLGDITFSEFTKIKASRLLPNSMGYFAYLRFMECYHGIVSMSHDLQGSLTIDGEKIDFNSGKGYIEKDWGTSFPKKYAWIQSNHFKGSDASIMCSIADIPFFGSSFRGFICNLSLGGREYRFASYNHSKLIDMNNTNNNLTLVIVRGDLMLEVHAKMADGGTLKAPKRGTMDHTIKEGLNGVADIKLTKKSGEVVFQGIGNPCGMELVDNLGQ